MLHEETGNVRILLSKSTIQKVSERMEGGYGGYVIPTFDLLRYMPPEHLEYEQWSIAGSSWAIGIMM